MGGVRVTRIRLWTWLLAVVTGSVGALYLTVATTPLDLAVYRLGGTNVLHDHAALYSATIEGYPFTYPPLAAILFTPLAVTPERLATLLVTLASMLALARTILLVARRTPGAVWHSGWAIPLALAASGALEPVYETFHFAQVNLLIMWAVVEDLLAPPTRRWRGLLLGVVAGVKLTPLAFLLLPLLRRQWRTLGVSLGTFVGGVALGFAVIPAEAYEFWTRAMFDPSRTGDVGFAANQSLNGLVARAAPAGGTLLWWVLGEALVLAATVLVTHRLLRAGARLPAILATAMGKLLFSPVSWVHHFVWEVPVLLVLLGILTTRTLTKRATILTWTLVAGWLLASLTRMPYWFPFGDGREYARPWPEQLVTDSFVFLAIATLIWLAFHGAAAVSSHREVPDEQGTPATERT